MASIRIEGFSGIAPRYSDRLLPQQAATIAANVKLVSGELRGIRELLPVADFSALAYTVRRAFRIPADQESPVPINPATDTWIPFEDAEVDFVRTPVLNDTYNRFYWTGDSSTYSGAPKYNTKTRLLASSVPYRLGIPRPTTAPTVTPAASGVNITRAYVYTFVSAYGEEGQPSDATLATGNAGTWNLSNIDSTVPNPTERNITTVNIYRTVPGITSTQFFFVGSISLGTTTYADTSLDVDVAQNPLLESTSWAPPPATLQGLTVHPAGFMIGFSGRDLYMSEPFRPHAWPVEYVLTMQTEIVGLAVFNNSIVVATNSHPYVGEGMTPASVNLQKLDSIDPCLSRRSIVTTLAGVMYSSVQGLILIGPGGPTLVTKQLFTREEWYNRYNPGGVTAAPYGLQYIAFDTPQTGFIFTPDEQLAPLTELDQFIGVTGIQIDPYSGDICVIHNDRLSLWDPLGGLPYSYQWKSKVFELPAPVNFGVLQVKFRNQETEIGAGSLEVYQDYNTARIAWPLNCVNIAAVNAVNVRSIPSWPYPQNKTPVGGSPLYSLAGLSVATPAVTIRVTARMGDSTMQEIFAHTVTDEGVYRLPADFMSDVWQIEVVSNTDVYSVTVAGTAKELART